MRCTSPRQAGYKSDGVTVTFSAREYGREFIGWQVPCGKCLSCRLEYAREWAVRCVHEAQMHAHNSFITLTYSDDRLESPKLNYGHFQTFMKDLRSYLDGAGIDHQIGFFVTGEYGDIRKRPHWHACLFGYDWTLVPEKFNQPSYKYSNERGDKIYESDFLSHVWDRGIAEFGSVTFESAGYCARYAAKKLVHGNDQDHEFHPVSKKSSKYAIGKSWLEKYYRDVFNYGRIVLEDGSQCGVPRYYERWFKEHHPEEWLCYIREVKYPAIDKAIAKQPEPAHINRPLGKRNPLTHDEVRNIILESKFNQLQKHLKL